MRALERYGINGDEPVVVVIHLVSPRIEYVNYGKSEINTGPFERSLARTLYKACSFYYHHNRGGGTEESDIRAQRGRSS